MKKILVLILCLIPGFLVVLWISKPVQKQPAINTTLSTPSVYTTQPSSGTQQDMPTVSVIATHLDTPWALAFLPDNRLLFTERAGQLRIIASDGSVQKEPIARINEAQEVGEGGLLGLAVHPDFINNHHIYLYYTYSGNTDSTLNRVVRYRFENETLTDKKIIIDAIPGAVNHNGGRLKFGPDNFLYITTGDAGNPSLAQDKNSLSGKILRVTGDGDPAPGNPFNTRIYSYGHRNPQGLAWTNNNQLFEVEHGPNAHDEINVIQSGKNYGWPIIQGDKKRNDMLTPLLNSDVQTWAPGGAAVFGESVFFGGLRGQTLYKSVIHGDEIQLREYFQNEFGRIRDVIIGPDGLLYITTSNKDGRGNPKLDDDKIIRINPNKL